MGLVSMWFVVMILIHLTKENNTDKQDMTLLDVSKEYGLE